MATTKKTILITGCTTGGIGHALARDFHAQGLHVIATARDRSKITDLEEMGITTLSLQVDLTESILAAKKAVEELTGGRLDILVNNAGRGYAMPATDLIMSEVKAVFQTNLFAVIELTQAFTPFLVATRGLIINIGSVAAILPFPFHSIYSASKAALRAYSSTLRIELSPFSVRVMLVTTGGVKSNIARYHDELPPDSLYLPIQETYRERLKLSQEGAMRNEDYARGVVEQALRKEPKRELWRGSKTWRVWFISSFFGDWLFDRMLLPVFALDKLKVIMGAQNKSS